MDLTEKSILVTAEKVVPVEVVKILLINYRIEDFSDEAKKAFVMICPSDSFVICEISLLLRDDRGKEIFLSPRLVAT